MIYDQDSNRGTETKQYKSLLSFGMVGIRHDTCILVKEGRSGFFKGNAMLPLICSILPFVPFEYEAGHLPTS